MKQETNCPGANNRLQTKSLPFSDVPEQSKLFLDYLKNPLSLKKYYPSAVASHARISERIPEVLANYKTDRRLLCDVLEETNRENGAGEKTLENLNLLRDGDCVAVVSGQQAGLFTGALYTIYKALSAVKLAECLRARGCKAVPVFWIAAEDHDFDEVSATEIIGRGGELFKLKNKPKDLKENTSVGYAELDDSICETIDELFAALPRTEFTGELKKIIAESWSVATNYGDAFARMLAKITGRYGLIMFNPLDERLKKLAAPVYAEAVKKSDEIVSALLKRGERLKEDGYHAQVLITPEYFPLFWQAEDKTRHAIKKNADKETYKIKDYEREFSREELAEIAAREPHRFSPGVVLRAVVQDYLLPGVCYFGGAAEVAYFAQSSEVYRILKRPVTTIFHRQSFTIIEPKHAKTLKRYDLSLKDLFKGVEAILPQIVEKYLDTETARAFVEAEEKINAELNFLQQSLMIFDPTLAENLTNRRRKIVYHLENLRGKFHRARMRRDKVVARRIETALNAIVPNKHLQERSINVASFVNLYGLNLIDWIYDAIDLDDKQHRIIYL